ncbi:hypothetical protein ACFW04_011398 [Cataglyphis niger]
MHPYSHFKKDHYYILTIIDVLSRYTWAVPFKSKGESRTVDAIAEIIRDSKRCPRNMQTDMGKEFYNINVQRLIKKHDINHYSTYSLLKASLGKPQLVSDYNACKHRTIGMRFIDVTSAIAERLLATVYNAIKIASPAKFKVTRHC